MQCEFFLQGHCFSCERCQMPYSQQIALKDKEITEQFSAMPALTWLPPVVSEPVAFRNKAKMAVLGTQKKPILGVYTRAGSSVSLVRCPLYSSSMQAVLTYLQIWIALAQLAPYDVRAKAGEIKYVLLTQSVNSGQMLLRLVLNSEASLPKIIRHLPTLRKKFAQITVISANIQPVHMARLEGDKEIFLTDAQSLLERFNDVPMVIRPKSFFQTNPKVAEQLYATAREWVRELAPPLMWDLFCGVGGFALHCAGPKTAVTAIEIEPEAVASAKQSAALMGIDNIDFAALDLTQFSLDKGNLPQLVLVNPPRRGLGAHLCAQLESVAPAYILYSSCNLPSMLTDLTHLSRYQPCKAQWFDMFAHTQHAEVLCLLQRTGDV
ncbi:MAG: 23S rRNA (uracil(747)-C(5))-methyltransferase RlmC [Vibrionaceae bacterium]